MREYYERERQPPNKRDLVMSRPVAPVLEAAIFRHAAERWIEYADPDPSVATAGMTIARFLLDARLIRELAGATQARVFEHREWPDLVLIVVRNDGGLDQVATVRPRNWQEGALIVD